MYKVFIVDDEINIVHGIAKLVNWTECQATLSGKAYHGQMALEMIQQDVPHIVLTDIKMPEINGIELIEKVQAQFPHIKFIILSGYDEFEFAKTAMKYGVKHYLLKPTNRKKIEKALKEVISDLEDEAEKERFIENIRQDLQKMIPIAQKQFLREYITNPTHEWKDYQQLFQIDDMHQKIRMLVMVIDQSHDFEPLFALHEMITQNIPKDYLYLSTTIGNKVVLLVKNDGQHLLSKQIKHIQKLFHNYYRLSFTTGISHPGNMNEVYQLYQQANNCLTQRFYLGAGSIITSDDMKIYNKNLDEQFNYEDFIYSLRSGDIKAVRSFVNHFFHHIKKVNMDIGLAKTYCVELLMAIMRHVSQDKFNIFFQQLVSFHEFQTLAEMKMFIMLLATEVTKEYDQRVKQTQHQVIQKVLRYLDENIHDEQLTLAKVAHEVVYMNPDYLGRLFKRELGENFSSYLMRLRINKAISIINQSTSVKIFEVACQVGFSNNPKYFGQVFKKYTGVTPTEYKQEMTIEQL